MWVLDEKVDFRRNAALVFTEYRSYTYLVLFTALADAVSTTLFMWVDGIDRELNPIVRTLSAQIGIFLGPLIGKLAQLAALWAITCVTPKLIGFLCWAVIAINTIAVTRNLELYWSRFG